MRCIFLFSLGDQPGKPCVHTASLSGMACKLPLIGDQIGKSILLALEIRPALNLKQIGAGQARTVPGKTLRKQENHNHGNYEASKTV